MSEIPRLTGKERVILDLLIGRGEMYGLAMVKSSRGKLKRGTIYITLQRMAEGKGLVTSREEIPEGGGPPRRIYRVTGHGKRVYNATLAAEQAFHRKLVPEGGV